MKPRPVTRSQWAAIRLLAMDVDGVLTDGTVGIGPGGEVKFFSVLDGMGLARVLKAELAVAWISGRPKIVRRDLYSNPQPSHCSCAGNGAPQCGHAIACSDTSCWHVRQGFIQSRPFMPDDAGNVRLLPGYGNSAASA